MQYINGEYVITGVQNAFNSRTSYWISKKDCIYSAYCFSGTPAEAERQLKEGWPGYIELYESLTAVTTSSYMLGEVIFDMTMSAASFTEALRKKNRSLEFDSRDLYASIYDWAKEFEASCTYPDGEYLDAVDAFVAKKLKDYFEIKEYER